MLPTTLVTALIALGSACIIISISIFHYFRERIDTYVSECTTKILTSKETTTFIKDVKSGIVSKQVLKDFFNDLIEIWKPEQWLTGLWRLFPLSGLFFILVGILGSFSVVEIVYFDYLLYFLLTIGLILFVSGTIQLIRLGSRLTGKRAN